ncbi:tRNA (guanine-N(7)-)-methyltransferase non-catalytic subunit trm82 [Ascosphaera pollenicola]|nr:tRNA (guanine-N(7)-)-methyltransferase non-catalytic subunit trm82 [Ascosphaera pollenicola]
MSFWSRTGHSLAWVLGIDLSHHDINYANDPANKLTNGESILSKSDVDEYIEEEPRTIDYLRDLMPSGAEVLQYLLNLVPFLTWIFKYNVQWLIGDLIAGVTVGCVVVPQGMAYAKLAELPAQFGLYSSFMGVLVYWFFATSKDITIGPVAVMSTLTGEVVSRFAEEHPEIPGHVVASALSIIAGAIITFIGLIRCGWIVDFISLPAISAFMTGSAISIAAGQVPKMMGITGFSTRGATYMVIINTLKHLGRTTIDAAMGLTAMTMLYLIRFFANWGAKRYPKHAKIFFYISTLRTTFVILLYTAISAGVNLHRRDHPRFSVLGTVPRGFRNAAVPQIDTEMISNFASELPASVIVLIIEHIAISKSFGRVNNYTINPSQEFVAIGITNLLGPFLGAYPATGSFSRTAIKSKAGVRTPLAGLITAAVVLLAIYALPAVFWYIPDASLAGVIIHAVGDLITPPSTVYKFWRVNPIEVLIFFIGVIVTIFTSIENGIYCTVCISAAVLLFRIIKAKGYFLGPVRIRSVVGDDLIDDGQPVQYASREEKDARFSGSNAASKLKCSEYRNIFLPFDHHDGSNPDIHVQEPYPGIFIYRLTEGLNYLNANHLTDNLVATIFQKTRRTVLTAYNRPGDRPWNDPGDRKPKHDEEMASRPTLKAIILDFSAVNNVDITSIQNLIDVRNQLDQHAAPQTVDWHFAHVHNRWTKRALASAGFGYITHKSGGAAGVAPRWNSIFSVAEIGGPDSAAAFAEIMRKREAAQKARAAGSDPESQTPYFYGKGVPDSRDVDEPDEILRARGDSINDDGSTSSSSVLKAPAQSIRRVVVTGLNRPLFHVDLTSALQSAIANVIEKESIIGVEGDPATSHTSEHQGSSRETLQKVQIADSKEL